MPVKRSLKLDVLLQENSPKSRQSRGQLIASYSPTTGTRQISPYSSPRSHNGRELRNGPSNGRASRKDELKEKHKPTDLRNQGSYPEQVKADQRHTVPRRGQPRAEDKDDIMILLYTIDKSLGKFTETWQSLKHLQTLMGQPELENLIGVSCTSLDLRSELQKTRELMIKARKWDQLGKKTLPRDFGHLNSYEFLKSIIN
ncbi:centromere protein R [Sminthopsis crassicaudata]|uniref:centromere protein R n=1 Tax=Sminthopsis crassicaudata TaxID=9301 RepID=UPI003D697B02